MAPEETITSSVPRPARAAAVSAICWMRRWSRRPRSSVRLEDPILTTMRRAVASVSREVSRSGWGHQPVPRLAAGVDHGVVAGEHSALCFIVSLVKASMGGREWTALKQL